jgi:hypothetical protein
MNSSSTSLSSSSSFVERIQQCQGQALKLDINALLVVIMISCTFMSLEKWVSVAASDLQISTAPLQYTLFVVLITEVIGRSQRNDHLKNAEAMARWTWVVFPLSCTVFPLCGFRGLSFYYLVVLLRFLMDMYRTVYRCLTNDPTADDSVAIQGSVQLLFGCLVLPTVVFLSATIARGGRE